MFTNQIKVLIIRKCINFNKLLFFSRIKGNINENDVFYDKRKQKLQIIDKLFIGNRVQIYQYRIFINL